MDRSPARREQLRAILQSAQVDALLVSSTTNVSYLTGFSGDSSVLVATRTRDVLVSDGRFTTQLAQECSDVEAHIRSSGEDLHAALAHVLETLGLKRVGFEATSLDGRRVRIDSRGSKDRRIRWPARPSRGIASEEGRRRDRSDPRRDSRYAEASLRRGSVRGCGGVRAKRT